MIPLNYTQQFLFFECPHRYSRTAIPLTFFSAGTCSCFQIMEKMVSPVSFKVRRFIFQSLWVDECILYGARKTHAQMIFRNGSLGKNARECGMVQDTRSHLWPEQRLTVIQDTAFSHYLALMLPQKEESEGFRVLTSSLKLLSWAQFVPNQFQSNFSLNVPSVHDCLWLGNPSQVGSVTWAILIGLAFSRDLAGP